MSDTPTTQESPLEVLQRVRDEAKVAITIGDSEAYRLAIRNILGILEPLQTRSAGA